VSNVRQKQILQLWTWPELFHWVSTPYDQGKRGNEAGDCQYKVLRFCLRQLWNQVELFLSWL
jgi:hypothetical protein